MLSEVPGTGYEKLMDPNVIDMVKESTKPRDALRTLGDEPDRVTDGMS
jgi:hypothetical protein